MKMANGAFNPRGLEGRGSRVDFLRVAARMLMRSGEGEDGKGVSQ